MVQLLASVARVSNQLRGQHSMMQKHVLVADDEELMRSLLSRGLNRAGFLVPTAHNAEEALPLRVDGVAPPSLAGRNLYPDVTHFLLGFYI